MVGTINDNYRTRVYSSYVTARHEALAPQTVEGLRPRAPYIKRLVQQHFPKDKSAKILDVGCGHGAILYFAQQAGFTDTGGVDGSPEQVAAAKRLGIKGVEEGDLMTTLKSLPSGAKDCIVAFDVIEHFTKNEVIDFVDEVHRVLTPGGRWIIHAPNGESIFGGRMRYWDLTHEIAYTRQSIAQLLYSSGFSDVRSFEDEPVIHGLKSLVRWILWRLIRGELRLFLAAQTGDPAKDAIFTQNFLTVATKAADSPVSTF